MITRSLLWTTAVATAYDAMRNNRRLYDGDHGAVFLAAGKRLPFELVIPNLLGECLTEPLCDLLFPDIPTVKVGEATDTAVDELLTLLGWSERLYPTSTMVSYAGEGIWKQIWNPLTGQPELVCWGLNDGEFTTWSPDGRAVNFWYTIVIESGRQQKAFKVRERHELEDGGTRMTNAAFPMQGSQVKASPIAWASAAAAWEEGQQPEEEVFFAGLTLLPGYRIENVGGRSDYTISRKNIQWRMILLESARNFSVALTTVPQLMIPPGAVNPSTGQLDWEKLVFQYKRPGDGSTAVLDMKTAVTSLGDSTDVLGNLWDDWNAINPISPLFYGKAVGSDASGKALTLSLTGTEVAVKRRRRAYVKATQWALQFARQLQAFYAGGTTVGDVAALTLDCGPALPEDPTERSTRISDAQRNGRMSTKTAIREEHPDWTEQQIADELAEIEGEKERERALAVPTFSQPGG